MSAFLEILKCILCCIEDPRDEDDYEILDGSTLRETVWPSKFGFRSGLRSTDISRNFEKTYVKTVTRNDGVPSTSSSYTKYEPSPTKLTPWCSTPPRPKPPPSSSTASPQLFVPSIPSIGVKLDTDEDKLLAKQSPSLKLKPTLSPASSNVTLQQTEAKDKGIDKNALPFRTVHQIPSIGVKLDTDEDKLLAKQSPSLKLKPTLSPASTNVTLQQPEAKDKGIEKNALPFRKVHQIPSIGVKLDTIEDKLSAKQSPSLKLKPTPKAPLSCLKHLPSSSKDLPSFKRAVAPTSPNIGNEHSKANYIWIQKGASPLYAIPKDVEDLIKKVKVPEVLKRPLSLSTYKDYFAALLYAEDFHIEEWKDFKLSGISLKLEEATIFKSLNSADNVDKDYKTFVKFEIDAPRTKRPFLLSRDFVLAKPSGSNIEPFKGVINRVVKSSTVLVEFGENFHLQHYVSCKYDVSFSFNRVCLKRAHQAIDAASDPSFESFTFPKFYSARRVISVTAPHYFNYKFDADQMSAVQQMINFRGSPPYVIEGPLSVTKAKWNLTKQISRSGMVIVEAVLKIYERSPDCRILISAPTNGTCDLLTSSLKKQIPESNIFRGNAAFREIDGVPLDILPTCVFKGECFTCPPVEELREFKVIVSTYVSSFRLHSEGINAGHFSHIFLVDASSIIEPEAMIPLANFANDDTAVIVSGALGNCSGWVRSDIARKNGLMKSYFERLHETLANSGAGKQLFLAHIDYDTY